MWPTNKQYFKETLKGAYSMEVSIGGQNADNNSI